MPAAHAHAHAQALDDLTSSPSHDVPGLYVASKLPFYVDDLKDSLEVSPARPPPRLKAWYGAVRCGVVWCTVAFHLHRTQHTHTHTHTHAHTHTHTHTRTHTPPPPLQEMWHKHNGLYIGDGVPTPLAADYNMTDLWNGYNHQVRACMRGWQGL